MRFALVDRETVVRSRCQEEVMLGKFVVACISALLCGGCAGLDPIVNVPPERLISSNGAGQVPVAAVIPPALLGDPAQGGDYSSLWDQGYFDWVGHRLIHIASHDLTALMSPKGRVQHLLVGEAYKTSSGLGVGSTLSELFDAYGDLPLREEKLDASWLYRPDLLKMPEYSWMKYGKSDQPGWRSLTCVARSDKLRNVSFYFESCELGRSGSPIEAVLVSNPDDVDMRPVDPFLDLSDPPPCPAPRTEDAAKLAREGHARLREKKMGDYHYTPSVQIGLPMLRDAALSGSSEAGNTYAGMVFIYVHQEVLGDPLDRVLTQGAQEALFFRILNVLRAPEPPPSDSCRAALIDFDTPINDEMFEDSDDGPPAGVCGGQYQFHWLSHADIEGIRQQARAWSTCWPRP
jgi:hypothetical protein